MGSEEHSIDPAPVAAVTFDVTHTLIHSPRLAEIYSSALARHGIRAAPADVERALRRTWQEVSCRVDPRRDRFTHAVGGARGWWHRFLTRLCQHLEAPPPTRFATAELFDRFARADAWEVYPDVVETLSALAASGLPLGVVSNWDRRLPQLLARLGLDAFFDAVVTSSDCGVEKPHPLIFERCLRQIDVEPRHAVHVGDHALEDVEGARGVGMQAVRVDRRAPGPGLRRLLAPLLTSVRGGRDVHA